MEANKTVLKSIFEYDNYREYLRDYYHSSKAKNPNFSYRFFARVGGFKSGNVLKVLIDGKMNLSLESIEKFCKALKFNKEESHFFRHLVLFNQAKTADERALHSKELLRSHTYRKIHPLSEAQYRYLELWYVPVVRGLVALSGFKEDPHWIAQKIIPAITPSEAKKALDDLLALGLLSRKETGELYQTNPVVSAMSSIVSTAMAHFHRQMMRRAAESIDNCPRERRDLSALTTGVSPEGLQILKELAEKFRRDVIEAAEQHQGHTAIYQMNIHLFPVTESISEEGEN